MGENLFPGSLGFVGREQIGQDGVFCSLTPRFVNDDWVTAEIIYSTTHARHEVLAWPQAAFVL